jgi:CHAT domain-containing protein
MSNLAEKHRAIASTGSTVTKAHFVDVIQQSALLHFHGHCLLDSDVLTEQSLELADGYLLAKEVFDMKLRNPHITLIACESASQGIAAGDEPLGLVTALLCAGASSVVGTIWPTASGTGRLFADVFYANLERQRDELGGNSGIFNIADALRSSVIWLRGQKDTRHPYCWASFVLHGSWFMNVPDLKSPSSDDEDKNEARKHVDEF